GSDVALSQRAIDVLGGIPLSSILGPSGGEDSLHALGVPPTVTVHNLDDLISTGIVADGPQTYRVTLSDQQAQDLADGLSVTITATVTTESESDTALITLAPEILDFQVTDLDAVLATAAINIDGLALKLKLESAEIALLLAGQTAVVRGQD